MYNKFDVDISKGFLASLIKFCNVFANKATKDHYLVIVREF